MKVWGGSIKRGQGQEINVTGFFAHANFSFITPFTISKAYDIAVGRLKSPFVQKFDPKTNSYNVNTVCLPHEDSIRYVPSNATIFGFGLTNHPNCTPNEIPYILNKGIVPISEFEDTLLSGQHRGNDSRHCPVSSLLF